MTKETANRAAELLKRLDEIEKTEAAMIKSDEINIAGHNIRITEVREALEQSIEKTISDMKKMYENDLKML